MDRSKVALVKASAALLQVAVDQLEGTDEANWEEQSSMSFHLVKVVRKLLGEVSPEEEEPEAPPRPETPPPATVSKPIRRER